MSGKRITRVSRESLEKMKDRTDSKRLEALTEAEIARAAADDPDATMTEAADWVNARVVWPQRKEPVTLRLDKDILAWFRRHGRGYQTRINAVLRAFVEAQQRRRDVQHRPRGAP